MTGQFETIDDFQSLSEFNHFVAWIHEQVRLGNVDKIPVLQPYLNASTFEEQWFREKSSGDIWRLVWPDSPFTGLFDRID